MTGALERALAEQEQAWESRPFLRRLYRDWYRLIRDRLAAVDGPVVELGSGIGRLREIVPHARLTDVEPTLWADEVVDAEALPYADGSVGNLVLLDVFHHLGRPAAFLDEARRVLHPGGRVVIVDPYCSPLSVVAYRAFHHERTDLGGEAFEEDAAVSAEPLASNQARTTLAFFRRADEYARRWPELPVVERRLLSVADYPVSGGFSRRPLAPAAAYGALRTLERVLSPVRRLAAFRCLVVLERR
jgi:SAM-dependent methyltransferase